MDSTQHNGALYAIFDRVAEQHVGQIMLHKADASAIRTFGDIASQEGTVVNKHVADYELHRLGYLSLGNNLTGLAVLRDHDSNVVTIRSEVIITGAQWLAAQAPAQDGAQ